VSLDRIQNFRIKVITMLSRGRIRKGIMGRSIGGSIERIGLPIVDLEPRFKGVY
jgi:hypothetical protein